MKDKEMTKANVESVLLEFRTEAGAPRPAILDAYCKRYPQFARELTDYAVEWLIDEALETAQPLPQAAASESNPLVSRALSRLYNRIRERDTAAGQAATQASQARNPFEGLVPARKRAICNELGIDMPLFAKFQNRLIEVETVPRAFVERFARSLEAGAETLLGYLKLPAMANAAADFKAKGKPSANSQKQRFEDAVRASSLEDKQKQALLEE